MRSQSRHGGKQQKGEADAAAYWVTLFCDTAGRKLETKEEKNFAEFNLG